MSKKILTLVLVIAMSALFAGCQQQASSDKVAVIDANKVFKECKAGAEGIAYLKAEGEKFQAKFAALQKNMSQNKTDAKAAQEMQKELTAYQAKMTGEQNRILTALNDGLMNATNEYRKENKISIVIPKESAISFDASTDITDKIIAKMNKMDIKTKP